MEGYLKFNGLISLDLECNEEFSLKRIRARSSGGAILFYSHRKPGACIRVNTAPSLREADGLCWVSEGRFLTCLPALKGSGHQVVSHKALNSYQMSNKSNFPEQISCRFKLVHFQGEEPCSGGFNQQ